MENNDQIFDPKDRQEIPVDFNRPSAFRQFLSRNKVIIASSAAVILVVGIFWIFLSKSPTKSNPTSDNVLLQIKGPDKTTSDNEAEYTIIYRNGENADLVGLSMELFYPSGFKFKSADPAPVSSAGQTFNLPVLKQGQDASVVIRGKLSGSTGEDKELKARLHYRLSNFNSEFVVSESIHTAILAPNLVMDVSGPVDVVNGQDTTFTVTVTNVSGQNFTNVAIQLTYPIGFNFTSSSVKAAKNNNYWIIPSLLTGSSQSIDITGNFTGDNNEEKLVRADLGQIINNNFAPQIASTANFHIIPSSLVLTVTAQPDAVVKLGDTITYQLKYANRGAIGLSNLVITLDLEGSSLDYSRISATNAIITNHILTWKAATLSNLAVLSPNEEGEIQFTVRVKDSISTNLKNQTIVATGTIASDELSKGTRTPDLILKVISELGLTVGGDYVSGAAPLQVGKTTVIAMTLMLTNMSNDLTDTEVIASLPLPSSAWKNVIIPDSEAGRLSYDPGSGKIRWRLGDVPAFTGKFIPALKVTFQLAVTPTVTDKGAPLTLLSNIQASGTDTFIGQNISAASIGSVNTSDIDDDTLNQSGGTVQ